MDQTSRPVIVEPDWRYVFLPLIQK
jgi:hypothetical protein